MIYKHLVQIHINKLLVILILFLLIGGCTCNRNYVDVSGIKVNLKVQRLDQDLFQFNSQNFNSQLSFVENKYGDFFPFYCGREVLLLGYPDTLERFKDSLLSFINYKYTRESYDTVQKKFGDFSKQKTDIETAFKYMKYYFPLAKIPTTLITYISGFSVVGFTYGDSVVALGLDMYLGNKFALYQGVQDLPEYIIRKLRPEYITPNAVHVTLTGIFGFQTDGKKLIDNMIYYGKILYVMNKLLPNVPDTIISGYTQRQLNWCKYNEGEVWKFFIGNNLLFDANEQDYFNYVSDGPTTNGMAPDAPGNIGSWVGWQIVQKYMERFPNTTLPQLMANTNSQQILDDSHYKP